jgi:hypothetical protein
MCFSSPVRALCPTYLILFYLIILMIFVDWYKLSVIKLNHERKSLIAMFIVWAHENVHQMHGRSW